MNGGKKLMKCNINICCFILFSVVIASIMLLISGPSLAQSTPPKLKDVIEGAPEKKEAEDQLEKELKKTGIPVDELDRGVPLTSVKGFFKATRERDYERAAEYLDLRNLPRGMDKNQGPQLARHLLLNFAYRMTLAVHLVVLFYLVMTGQSQAMKRHQYLYLM